ncbi:MAG TPA: cellulase family glycosylhydrolase [Bryobacteraceae bacterium]|nr:cellulase family glycosylhydrolase [Bryobacteraceae bacterium]
MRLYQLTSRALVATMLFSSVAVGQSGRWTQQKADAWYARQPWLVGANYAPANAINQIEMWQADTFDPKQIDKELGWAAGIGMNTMRVFLHDLVWQQDPEGYRKRLDQFLTIAQKHGVRTMFVLFDSVWDPFPAVGKQRDPKPGVHNSGWVQGPGLKALQDPAQERRLEAYVKGVVGAFAKDRRVLAWDIWNEPDNPNTSAYGEVELRNKNDLVLPLLRKSFAWARAADPQQPLTSGLWHHPDWSSLEKLTPIERVQVEESDVISFHSYDSPETFHDRILQLVGYNRPLLCTEYMARGNNSTFAGSLPIAKEYNVAAYNWGLVQGKTQTHLPWDSWKQPYVGGREPTVWFHEVFRPDGTAYRPNELELIRKVTGKSKAIRKAA